MKTTWLLLAYGLFSVAGCALVDGEPGQQESLAVLVSCEPLQNGGRLPAPAAGQTCEQEAAQWYRDYANDLKDAAK